MKMTMHDALKKEELKKKNRQAIQDEKINIYIYEQV